LRNAHKLFTWIWPDITLAMKNRTLLMKIFGKNNCVDQSEMSLPKKTLCFIFFFRLVFDWSTQLLFLKILAIKVRLFILEAIGSENLTSFFLLCIYRENRTLKSYLKSIY
jgi:hypothetical protein